MDLKVFNKFIWFIKERESIRRKKEFGSSPPWTDDHILQRFKFCNIWRQDDKTTKAIQERLSIFDKEDGLGSVILNIFLLRLINRADVIKNIQLVTYEKSVEWDSEPFSYSDAFVILPHLSKGTKKIDEIKRLLIKIEDRIAEGENDVEKILTLPRIKGLILYEMMCDWWQFIGLEEDYCNIGNGAMPTLKALYPEIKKPNVEHIAEITDILNATEEIRHEKYGYLTWRCIEGAMCEFRKYNNLINNPKARKRYYSHTI